MSNHFLNGTTTVLEPFVAVNARMLSTPFVRVDAILVAPKLRVSVTKQSMPVVSSATTVDSCTVSCSGKVLTVQPISAVNAVVTPTLVAYEVKLRPSVLTITTELVTPVVKLGLFLATPTVTITLSVIAPIVKPSPITLSTSRIAINAYVIDPGVTGGGSIVSPNDAWRRRKIGSRRR